MSDYQDDTGMNVPDVFRPPLAPEEQPVVKKYNRFYGIAMLIVFLVIGVFAVLFLQYNAAVAGLADLKEKHKTELAERRSNVELLAARYQALDASKKDLMSNAAALESLQKNFDKYEWQQKRLTPCQKLALNHAANFDGWIGDKKREFSQRVQCNTTLLELRPASCTSAPTSCATAATPATKTTTTQVTP